MEQLKQTEWAERIAASAWVLVDFSSPGCAPCRKMAPLIEAVIAEKKELDLKAYEVNVADQPALAQAVGVWSVPTLVVFHEGRETTRFNGLPKMEKVLAQLG